MSEREAGRQQTRTFSLAYSTNAYPRGFPLSGPDLWKRKSSLEILPYLEKTCRRVYLGAKLSGMRRQHGRYTDSSTVG